MQEDRARLFSVFPGIYGQNSLALEIKIRLKKKIKKILTGKEK